MSEPSEGVWQTWEVKYGNDATLHVIAERMGIVDGALSFTVLVEGLSLTVLALPKGEWKAAYCIDDESDKPISVTFLDEIKAEA